MSPSVWSLLLCDLHRASSPAWPRWWRDEQLSQQSSEAARPINNHYRGPGVAGGLKGGGTPWWAGSRSTWPRLTCRGETRGPSGPPPTLLTCWRNLTQRFCSPVLHDKDPQTKPPKKKEKSATPVLERVLLTASKWEQAVGGWGGKRGRKRRRELHRDFFFLSPVTSCQFTPQRIRNQNLIKILNK